MKTPITEVERRELASKLEAACGGIYNFEGVRPECFFNKKAGKLLVNYVPDGFKMGVPPGFIKMFVAADTPGWSPLVLEVFYLN
jgi:hypothetical protein